jgi:hypothetical protein
MVPATVDHFTFLANTLVSPPGGLVVPIVVPTDNSVAMGSLAGGEEWLDLSIVIFGFVRL